MGYCTNAIKEKDIKINTLNNETQFAVEFSKKKAFSEKQKISIFPNPNGMSGGPVFQFDEKNPSIFNVVGIMTDWLGRSTNVIIGTKIGIISRHII